METSNNGFFSGISQLFSSVFLAGIFFAFLLYAVAKLSVRNYGVDAKIAGLEQQIATLSKSEARLKQRNLALESIKKRDTQTIDDLTAESKSYKNRYERQKGINKSLAKANEKLVKDTAQLHRKAFSQRAYIAKVTEERDLLRTNFAEMSDANQYLVDRTEALEKDVSRQYVLETALTDSISMLLTENANYAERQADFDTKEVLLSQNIESVKKQKARTQLTNPLFLLLGLIIGLLLSRLQKIRAWVSALRFPANSPKNTWTSYVPIFSKKTNS